MVGLMSCAQRTVLHLGPLVWWRGRTGVNCEVGERGGVSGREEEGSVLEVEVEESYFHVFLVVGIA